VGRAPLEEAVTGDTIAVDEVSMTADGRFSYFVYIWLDRPDHMQVDVGVARRVNQPPRRPSRRVGP